MEVPLCPSFNVVVVVAVCLDGPGPGPPSWLPGDGDGDECVSRAHPLGRRWKWRAAKLPRPSSAQHWRLVGNQCRDRSWTTPRRRRRHGRGSWLTDKPHQIPRVTSGQAPPHQRWLTRRGGARGAGGRWRGRGKVARRRLDDPWTLSFHSVASSNHWGGIKRGIWPHLDCCMITLGSRWKVPIVPELGTERSLREQVVKLRTTMVVSSWTSTQEPWLPWRWAPTDASEPGKSSFISTPPA